MRLPHDIHLAYCTNIHRGESWSETFRNLETHVLAVRDRVAAGRSFAIGLRLGHAAALELEQPATLAAFRSWLDRQNCYVFTINGFPYGTFHGARVKEHVYEPDWTTLDRVDYTLRLFRILEHLLPEDVEGSVSTVPGSFKAFIRSESQVAAMRQNLWRCIEYLAERRERAGRMLHLDLEPEPLCHLETSDETVAFFERMRADRHGDDRLEAHLRVNYDACHLAVEFEEPRTALEHLRTHGVRVGKFHFSSALRVVPTPEARNALGAFRDEVYLHQVIVRRADGTLERHTDLPEFLACRPADARDVGEEWRVHYHIPLHAAPTAELGTTQEHLLGVMDWLGSQPRACSHIEMETYTWDVLPPALKQGDVVDQLTAEYDWTLARLAERGLGLALANHPLAG